MREVAVGVGIVIAFVGAGVAPCLAFMFIAWLPALRGTTFISGTGEIGPGFYACLVAWFAFTVGALGLGGAVIAASILANRASPKTPEPPPG